MNKEQIIKDILERMKDKGISLENLSFDGDYKITINDLEIELTYWVDQADIYYKGESKHVGFIQELAKEIVDLLSEEEWEAGQLVRNTNHTRVVVTSSWYSDMFNLLNDETYKLEYQYTYTTAELKMLGWERVQ